jgi:hypothetical protein
MTDNQRQRIIQSINETTVILERANRYSPEFRDHDMIRSYEAVINRLLNCLATGQIAA